MHRPIPSDGLGGSIFPQLLTSVSPRLILRYDSLRVANVRLANPLPSSLEDSLVEKMTDQQLARLTEELRRCSPQTLEAAIRYREHRDSALVPVVVYGLIERYQPATSPLRLAEAQDDTRLIDDLGLDSLTLLELVLSIEEVLEVRIENEDLATIRTLGQLNTFLRDRLSPPTPEA